MAYTKPIQIDFNKVYQSNNNGPFKILETLGHAGGKYIVRVQFINTGTIKDVRYDAAMDGRIKDDLYGIDFDKVYNSLYYGPYKIISFQGRNKYRRRMVRVSFLNTGYEYDVDFRLARSGQVKDYSVGYYDRKIYYAPYTKEYNNALMAIYHYRWSSMMSRCYNPNNISYHAYGKVGVTVCEYWHNFDNYVSSMPYLMNYNKFYLNPMGYQLDKDYLQQNVPCENRVYSPDTCVFLSTIDNANLAMIKDTDENGYYGITYKGPNRYEVAFSIEGQRVRFGTYSNLVAAVNEYNFYYIMFTRFELVPLLNTGIERMTHNEAQKYLING